MKKLLTVVAFLSMVAMAHAGAWNIKWAIGGAYSPDDVNKGVLEDYSVTWSLIYGDAITVDAATGALSGATTIESMSAAAGSDEIYAVDPGMNNREMYYTSKLKSDGYSTYIGATDATGLQHVYQHIFIDNGVDQYYWLSSAADITVPASTTDAPTPIDSDVILGKSTAWTKVGAAAVPEPTTMSLLGLGALAMVLRRKVRK